MVLSAQEIEACLQATPCITEHDPASPQALAIARLYHLVSVDDPSPDVLGVRLMLGHQIALSGYGTDWLAQLQITGFDSYRYYWAINTCDRRLLIDAHTGEAAGPAHEDIMCTPMEPPMPLSTSRHDVHGNAS
jgi:hypothetical protein